MDKEKIKPGYPWKPKVEYYDIENGEQITKKEKEKNYISIKNTKKYYYKNGYNIIDQTIVCEKDRQTRLFS